MRFDGDTDAALSVSLCPPYTNSMLKRISLTCFARICSPVSVRRSDKRPKRPATKLGQNMLGKGKRKRNGNECGTTSVRLSMPTKLPTCSLMQKGLVP